MLGALFGYTRVTGLTVPSHGGQQKNCKDLVWNHNFISYRPQSGKRGCSPGCPRTAPQESYLNLMDAVKDSMADAIDFDLEVHP